MARSFATGQFFSHLQPADARSLLNLNSGVYESREELQIGLINRTGLLQQLQASVLLTGFHIDLIDQIYQSTQDVEAFAQRIPIRLNAQSVNASSLMYTDAFAYHVFGTD